MWTGCTIKPGSGSRATGLRQPAAVDEGLLEAAIARGGDVVVTTAGAVQLNEKPLERASYKVKGGDVFHITIPRPPRMRAEFEDGTMRAYLPRSLVSRRRRTQRA